MIQETKGVLKARICHLNGIIRTKDKITQGHLDELCELNKVIHDQAIVIKYFENRTKG